MGEKDAVVSGSAGAEWGGDVPGLEAGFGDSALKKTKVVPPLEWDEKVSKIDGDLVW
jgi:hypothetical protein